MTLRAMSGRAWRVYLNRASIRLPPLDGKIYALGGRWSNTGELTSVEVYDPATNSWTSAPSLQTARGGFAAVTVDEKIYVSAVKCSLAKIML